MATGFVKNVHRYEPYKNFKFRILMDKKPVLGVSKVGALKRTTEVVKHREGGENSTDHKSPGRTTYDAITLERGITHDREFERWANTVHPYAGDAGMMNRAGKSGVSATLRGQAEVNFFGGGVFFCCRGVRKSYNSFVFNRFGGLSGGAAKWERKKNHTDMS